MSRAIVTFGTGPHRELLEIALPSFRAYAERHGYELVICEEPALAPPGSVWMPRKDRNATFIPPLRPPSWLKIPVLQRALYDYDEVLWLDADIVIVDGSEDIASLVPDPCWQGLAVHNDPAIGAHPNHGVWYTRRPLRPTLDAIWQMDQYTNHPWWEQAASLELLGFNPNESPVLQRSYTPLMRRTHFLGSEWNFAVGCKCTGSVRFMHAASLANRAEMMRRWVNAGTRAAA